MLNLFFRCTYLYDTLRPKLIHETHIDTLCELVDILKVEVLGEQLSRRTESLAGLRPTLDRILADVHERLTFRARTHIRDEVDIVFQNYVLFIFRIVVLADYLATVFTTFATSSSIILLLRAFKLTCRLLLYAIL